VEWWGYEGEAVYDSRAGMCDCVSGRLVLWRVGWCGAAG
jgi:hypothetical protein